MKGYKPKHFTLYAVAILLQCQSSFAWVSNPRQVAVFGCEYKSCRSASDVKLCCTSSNQPIRDKNSRLFEKNSLKSIIQAAFLTGVFLLLPLPSLTFNIMQEPLHTSPTTMLQFDVKSSSVARAADAIDEVPFTSSSPQSESGAATSTVSISMQANKGTVLDEVWNLINKYYIDQTFNGQDWNQVKLKYQSIVRNSDSDDQMMSAVTKMVATLGDKYSRILDTQAYAAIQKFDLIGVGVTLMPDESKQIIVGAPPIADSPAAKAGLQVGDKITAVNGVPTEGRTSFDIIDQIAESPNAKVVSMTVQSVSDPTNVREVTMNRQTLEIRNPLRYKISEIRADGTKVGYIKIIEFNSLVKAKLEEAFQTLEAAGANAYVIDLRQNTGGAFQSAVEISGLLMEDRVATYVVDNTNVKLPFRTGKGQVAVDQDDPIVVWIDGRTASASEVLAGSLHDNCRAVLMGEKSFGKGLIQAVYGLQNGAGLVLTVARYVTPSGTDIQGVGITPDLGGEAVALAIPGFSTDTSKIDFNSIKTRLSPSVCQVPEQLK